MADKTVRIGVDAQEAQGFQSQMRQSAEALARDMIRSARSYSTSSKEVLKDIDAQIKAIEKRNRLDAEFKKTRLEGLRSEGKISANQYSKARSALSTENKEDQIQTRLLRDIIETIKNTSKEEIREDRKNVYTKVSSGRAAKLGVHGDELEALKETLQYGELSKLNVKEAKQRSGFNIGGAMSMGRQVAGGDVGGAAVAGGAGLMRAAFSNPYTAIGAMTLLTAGFSFMQNKNISESLKDYSITTGTPVDKLFGESGLVSRRRGWGKYGLSPIETLSEEGRMYQALGGESTNTYSGQLIGASRSRNISEDHILKLLETERYSSSRNGLLGGGESYAVLTEIEKYLRTTGQSISVLPEVLENFINTSNVIIQSTGKVNAEETFRTISSIGQSYGVSGTNLNRYTGAFQGAFSRSSNPQLQALQFRTMSELYPDEGLWELQTRMSDPMGQPEYIESMMNKIKEMYGGSEQGKFTMLEIFKPFGLGEKDVNNMWDRKFNSQEKGVAPTIDYLKELESKFVSGAEKTSQELINTKEIAGAIAASSTEKISDFFRSESFKNVLSGAFSDGIRNAKATDPTLFGN